MTATTPKHRLRWYQYSLRSLFVLTVLVAIAGSWFAVKRQQKEREREAVRAIRAMVESASGMYEFPIDVAEQSVSSEFRWLEAYPDDVFFAHVTGVRVEGKGVTDAGLKHLRLGLPQLKRLYLPRTNVTDAGLEHLTWLVQLEVLDLRSTQVTDTGLEHLKGLTQLKTLYLSGTNVTDEGVKRLQEALPDCTINR